MRDLTISLNDLTETGIHDLQLSNINVYPNPTTGMVTIDFSNITNKLIKIGIINVTGQVVYMEKIETKVVKPETSFFENEILSHDVTKKAIKRKNRTRKNISLFIRFQNVVK